MGMFFVGCCSGSPVPFYSSASIYSYDTGTIVDIPSSGPGILTGPLQQVSVGSGKTTVTFNGSVDDLAVLIPSGSMVTSTYNSSNSTIYVVLPSKYLILDPNAGFFTEITNVTDGAHSATIAAGGVGISPLTTAGIGPSVAMGSPIALTVLQSVGIADGNGNLSFIPVFVPSGSGHLTITSLGSA